MELDLSARRAARREAKGEGPTVMVDGSSFEMVPEMPLETLDLLSAGKLGEAIRGLFVDPDGFMAAAKPTVDDIEDLLGVYGVEPGGSGASTTSSGTNGTRSRPTSRASTKSTSRKRATARKR